MKKFATLSRIGNAIRARREAKGFSQEGFADRIEMHRTYYSAIERGEQNMTVQTLERVCKGLDVKMWDVLRDADD